MPAPAVALLALATLALLLVLAHVAFVAWVRRRFPPLGVRVPCAGRAVRVLRRGEGPPVVFVHGMNGSAHDFPDELLDDLARDHAVLALDRPGHAGSGRPAGPLDLAANARAVLAALAAAGGRPAVLVGHSYGAAVSLRVALDHPERVAALVLVTPCTRIDVRNRGYARLPFVPRALRLAALALGALPVGLLASRATRRDAWHPASPPPGWSFSRAWALVPAQLDASLENFHWLPRDLAALSGDLPRLAAPLDVLVGADDRVTPWRTHAAWLPGLVPGTNLHVIEGTGHWLLRQQPVLVAAAVRNAREGA